MVLLSMISAVHGQAQLSPQLQLSADTVLVDEQVAIIVSGLVPGQPVTMRLSATLGGLTWAAHAAFVADMNGQVDLATMAPTSGTYERADPMGLFWSARQDTSSTPPATAIPLPGPSLPDTELVQLIAEVDGQTAVWTTLRRRFVQEGVRLTSVREIGLVASFYEPPQPGPHPGLMILGGSGGGIPERTAQLLASHGYAALAVGYFGMDGLPASLSLIPLEYFGRALEWLQAQRAVDGTKIGVLGGSRGGELALLLGATYPQITAVAAYAPSHVVWPGCCDARSSASSAWSHHGEPLPFVPSTSDPTRLAKYAGGSPPLLLHRFLAALQDTVAVTRAAIPVERINGGVLLISGRDDHLWPSSQMADLVVARLQRYGFRHPSRHLSYEQAGHAIGTPYRPTTGLSRSVHPVTKIVYPMGGTPAGYARAQADSWLQVLGFLATHLKRLGPQNRR